MADAKEVKEAKEIKHELVSNEEIADKMRESLLTKKGQKRNFLTMCFGPYQDTYFGMLNINKRLSRESINEHCADIFDHMIQSNVITKKSEKIIFVTGGIDDQYHMTCIYRDKKIMERSSSVISDEDLILCKKIVEEHGEKPVLIYYSSYRLPNSAKAWEYLSEKSLNEVVDNYCSCLQSAKDIEVDFGVTSQENS